MKANELRIGNYVEHNGNWSYRDHSAPKIIQWEESDFYALGESTIFLEDIKPIQLTEEWLLKFGFEKNKSNKNRFIHYISGFEIERQGSKFAYAVWGGEDAPFLTQFFGHHNYVHQLQNLYFALTGEELTIKQ